MTAFLITAGVALALALFIALAGRRERPRAAALDPREDLRRRRLSWPPPSRVALLLARAQRVLNGGRRV